MSDSSSQNIFEQTSELDFPAQESSPFFCEVSPSESQDSYLIDQIALAEPGTRRSVLLSAIFNPASPAATAEATAALRDVPAATAAVKRGLDILASLFAIIVLLPILVTIVAVLGIQKGPVVFAQDRIGRGGAMFRCYKFRTMRVGADAMLAKVLAQDPGKRDEWHSQRKLADDPRITRFGKFLRLTSLDEVPQLLNVLKGDMSLVGPRPIVRSEIAKYRGYYAYYLSVRPGLTGLWQVTGRNRTTYRRRVALDVAYVNNLSLWLDARIVARTLPALFRTNEVS